MKDFDFKGDGFLHICLTDDSAAEYIKGFAGHMDLESLIMKYFNIESQEVTPITIRAKAGVIEITSRHVQVDPMAIVVCNNKVRILIDSRTRQTFLCVDDLFSAIGIEHSTAMESIDNSLMKGIVKRINPPEEIPCNCIPVLDAPAVLYKLFIEWSIVNSTSFLDAYHSVRDWISNHYRDLVLRGLM